MAAASRVFSASTRRCWVTSSKDATMATGLCSVAEKTGCVFTDTQRNGLPPGRMPMSTFFCAFPLRSARLTGKSPGGNGVPSS